MKTAAAASTIKKKNLKTILNYFTKGPERLNFHHETNMVFLSNYVSC
jgi:hypothetical protein